MPIVRDNNRSKNNANLPKNNKKGTTKPPSKMSQEKRSATAREASPVEATHNTGLQHRRMFNPRNNIMTTKKTTIQAKPIIRELNRRIKNYPPQFAPDYLSTALEYMLHRESIRGFAPTLEKINSWRASRRMEFEIDRKVANQISRIRDLVYNSRGKAQGEARRGKYQIEPSGQNSTQSEKYLDPNPPKSSRSRSDQQVSEHSSQNMSTEVLVSQAGNNKNVSKTSSLPCQSLKNSSNAYPPSTLTEFDSMRSKKQTGVPTKLKHKFSPRGQELTSLQWGGKQDKFNTLTDFMITLFGLDGDFNPVFPACYMFYMLLTSDSAAFDSLTADNTTYFDASRFESQKSGMDIPDGIQIAHYYMATAIFITSKYFQIVPFSLQDIINQINPSLSEEKVIKYESIALNLMDFEEFYGDNEMRYLHIFNIVANWTDEQLVLCQFILQNGLYNPHIYQYRPQEKAAVALALFQERFHSKNEKFNEIKTLIPTLTLEKIKKIKDCFLVSILYNYQNSVKTLQKKYSILKHEIEKILRINNRSYPGGIQEEDHDG